MGWPCLCQGVLVPESVAAGPSPIDSMSAYLTSTEVFPFEVGAGHTTARSGAGRWV